MRQTLKYFLIENQNQYKESDIVAVINNDTGRAFTFIILDGEFKPFNEASKLALQEDKISFHSIVNHINNDVLLERLKSGEKVKVNDDIKISCTPSGTRFDLYYKGDIIYNCGKFSHLIMRVETYK